MRSLGFSIKWSILVFISPLLGALFYLQFSDLVFSDRHSFERGFLPIHVEPSQVVEITVFGKQQTKIYGISSETEKLFREEIASKEKFVEKLFFPLLWYEFKLANQLYVATSTPGLKEIGDIELKCIDPKKSPKIEPRGNKNFWTQLSATENNFRFGCHISEVQGVTWQEFVKSTPGKTEIHFGGTLLVEWRLLPISQIFTFLLFFLVVALPTAVLIVGKSFREARSIVRVTKLKD